MNHKLVLSENAVRFPPGNNIMHSIPHRFSFQYLFIILIFDLGGDLDNLQNKFNLSVKWGKINQTQCISEFLRSYVPVS